LIMLAERTAALIDLTLWLTKKITVRWYEVDTFD
jgi:hypothetical protein